MKSIVWRYVQKIAPVQKALERGVVYKDREETFCLIEAGLLWGLHNSHGNGAVFVKIDGNGYITIQHTDIGQQTIIQQFF